MARALGAYLGGVCPLAVHGGGAYLVVLQGILKMADSPTSAASVFKTKPAVTRKHLKRDQAAARKARGAANVGDSSKDRQVCVQHSYLLQVEHYSDFIHSIS